jgi:O-antigen ligase
MDKDINKKDWYYLIPLVLLIIIVPLIVHLKIIPLDGAMYEFWNGQDKNYDFFSYYKMIWILICSVLALIMMFVKNYKNDWKLFKKSYFFIPIGIYSVFVFLSTILSEYKHIATFGFVDRYEGMFVLLAYMIILVAAINLVNEERQIKIVLGAIFTTTIIICSIGVFQYLGHDLWKSHFGKILMLYPKHKELVESLKMTLPDKIVYSTLYHYNYVGSYMAMLFPMSLAMLLLLKNKKVKIFMGLMSILTFINLLGSTSRAGVVGTIVALIMLIIMLNRYIIKHWKVAVVLLVGFVILFIGIDKGANGKITNRLSSLKTEITQMFNSDNKENQQNENNIPLKDIVVKDNTGEIVTDTETLKFKFDGKQIFFKDKNDNSLSLDMRSKKGKILLRDDRYKDYTLSIVKIGNSSILQIEKETIRLFFKLTSEKIALVDYKGNEIDFKSVEKWGFEGKERMGSARGYIWSRAIPLLKNTKILGHGPDTFTIYFPQNDILGKYYAYNGDMWELVDKPHNLYLQTGINTGVISLIALLILFIMYFVSSIRVFIKNEYNDFYSIVGVSIFVAVVGYLGAGFFNDSVVSVAPIFWVLLGIGISINVKLKYIKKF